MILIKNFYGKKELTTGGPYLSLVWDIDKFIERTKYLINCYGCITGIGCITGPSGLTVLDIDKKDDYDNSFIANLFCDKAVIRDVSQSGGEHYYYKRDFNCKNVCNNILNIDILTNNKSIYLPPTVCIDGGEYQWVNPPWCAYLTDFPEIVKAFAGGCINRRTKKTTVKYTGGKMNLTDSIGLLRGIQNKIGRPDLQTWLRLYYACVSHFEDKDNAIKVMQKFWPEEKEGSMKR